MKKQFSTALLALFFTAALFADAEKYGGGKPWINSMIKENIVSAERPSPKEDFHLYVNYDWLKKNDIPKGESTYGSFTEVNNAVEKKIIEVLTDSSLKGIDAENVQALYHALLDWDARNAAGLEVLQKTVDEIKAISTIEQLSAFITNPDKTFFVPEFVGIGNTTKFEDSTVYITSFGMDGFLLGDAAEYKKRTPVGERHYKACLSITKAMLPRLGYTEEEAEAMLNDTLKLETILASKAYTNAEKHSPDHIKKINNVIPAKKIASLAKSFPITAYIQNNGYGDAKEFLVPQPKPFADLNKVYKQKNLQLLKSYMIVKTAKNYASALDAKAYDDYVKATNIISGSTGKIADEKMAVNNVRAMLATPLNRAYLARNDLSGLKKRIEEICKSCVSIYRQMLTEEDWLSEATKKKAIEKLDNLRINAIYPEKWIDYSGLKLKGLSLVECLKAMYAFNRKLDVSHTNGKVDKELWDNEDLLVPNAFYDPAENSINIIPGLLKKPFYYEGMSQEALLGGIGAVIGHEISHAFDTNGAQYDKDGNLANWWTKSDFTAFRKRAAKLIAYYDQIVSWQGLTIKGEVIQTEAIADMAGIKAMLKYAETIPNFNHKDFFESYACIWRVLRTPEYDESITFVDPHPKSYLRTNVTLQQFEEFYKAFDVKAGDNMYLAPEKRILVW